MSIENIERKQRALQEAEAAMLTLNKHLGKEYYSSEIFKSISELKLDLLDARDEQEYYERRIQNFNSSPARS